ncbi:MAG: sulfatase-like hydrolase/transferase [Verrucomicrobia bacterium]|nr:sulfatase-like hydrolase/transferase [Verrucomicrobiota bacterium]
MKLAHTLCATLLVVTSSLAAAVERADAKPNFVLCMADDQGWGDMAYNGHPALKMPVFDQMSREGLRFDRFYAAAPVCSPTRAARRSSDASRSRALTARF